MKGGKPDKFRVSAFSLSLLFRLFPDNLQNQDQMALRQLLKNSISLLLSITPNGYRRETRSKPLEKKDDRTNKTTLKPLD